METRIHNYGNNPITFALEKNNGMMVNATEMAKAFDKNVGHFMENESTRRFLDACLNNRNSDYLGIKSEEDLIISRQKSGTYMHRILALKFAAWLSPDFEVWVFSTIEQILFGKHVERDNSFETTLKLMNEKEEIEAKDPKTVKDFERYLEIEKLLKQEKTKRAMLTREVVTGMKDMFV